jgi:3-isopropylmalate dehydrogenase
LAGEDKANPISQILTLAMMLDYLDESHGAYLVREAVSNALRSEALRIGDYGQPIGGTKNAAQTIALTLVENA